MGKTILGICMVLAVVGVVAVLAYAPTCEEKAVRAQATATRLAIENAQEQVDLQVKQGAASARIAALQSFYTALTTVGLLVVLALAVIVLLWLYNRASFGLSPAWSVSYRDTPGHPGHDDC